TRPALLELTHKRTTTMGIFKRVSKTIPTGVLVIAWLPGFPGSPSPLSTSLASEPLAKGIQDNSFLIEEAYNQEPGVVQHILNVPIDFAGGERAITRALPRNGQSSVRRTSSPTPFRTLLLKTTTAWKTSGSITGSRR